LRISLRGRVLGVAAALALVLLAPTVAHAATLTVNSGVYTYNSGLLKANKLNVIAVDNNVQFNEGMAGGDNITVSGTSAGTCTGSGTNYVTCTTTATSLTVNGGVSDAMADELFVSTGFGSGLGIVTVNAGQGDDIVSGSGTFNGDAGNDVVGGSNLPATLNGGSGNDRLVNGDQDQTFNGGTGADTVDYSQGGYNVTVSIDGAANDGPFASHDNVQTDVEHIQGSPGNDVLTGTVNGATTVNNLYGGGGDDVLNGNDGDDMLDGQGGADEYNGGAGFDTANYSARSADVQVTLNDSGFDGEVGERDNVHTDVESVTGGYGDDVLVASPTLDINITLNGLLGDDLVQGGPGDDAVIGGPGEDQIDGKGGNDDLNGSSGADNVDGGTGDDTIDGSFGFDHLDGGSGLDTLTGGDGPDELLIRDGQADTANCSAGTDRVVRDDAGDTVSADCETVEAMSAAQQGAVSASPTTGPATVAVLPVAKGEPVNVTVSCRVARRHRDGITCTVSFSGATPPAVTARLTRGGHTYAIARKRISGRQAKLRLRPVRRAHRGAYTLKLRDAGGTTIANVRVAIR
jgi:Ca2+-binding RTX toxin-like protein